MQKSTPMIDIHSHILYKLDDGPEFSEESFSSLKAMEDFGFTEIIPTPHRHHLFYNPPTEEVESRIKEINSPLIKRFSFEYMFSLESIRKEPNLFELYISPLGWRVILVELHPLMSGKADIEKSCYLLNSIGITPLLAHIERYGHNDEFWIDIKRKYSVFYQASLKNLATRFLEKKKRQIGRLIEIDLIDNLCTDFHSVKDLPNIEKGLEFVNNKFPEKVRRLFSINFETV